MSDAVQITTAICGVITAIGVPLVAVLLAWMNYQQSKAAAAVKEVKVQLAETTKDNKTQLDEMSTEQKKQGVVGEKTHALVNSAMAAQLRVTAVALRRVADVSGIAADMEAAELAEKNLADHQEKQKRADALYPGNEPKRLKDQS